MRRCITFTLVLAISCVGLAAAQDADVKQRPWERRGSIQPDLRANVGEGVGTVQYDPGAPADDFGLTNVFNYNYWYGNNFDTRNGQPLSPGTITNISWYQGGVGLNIAYLLGAPIGGPFTFISPVLVYTSNTFFNIPANIAAPSPRFVGVAGITYNQVNYFGSVGLRSASTNNQGFHGTQRAFTTGFTGSLPGQNAMVRVSGTIIVPVELMEFDVE